MEWEFLLNANRRRKSKVDSNRLEKSGNTDHRNPFESDFGRVIFSSSCRRLHDKTQVFPLTSDDNIHSRLTHSMEVMNIGLSFGIYFCGNEELKKKTGLSELDILRKISPILKTSCLVHDIGNPPFGHFGEVVIQEYFKNLFTDLENVCNGGKENSEACRYIYRGLSERQKEELKDFLKNELLKNDYTQFDGNAEGFRILTKLQYLGDLFGLNLTYATLAATLKYPNHESKNDICGSIGKHKHGVFYTEKEILKDVIRQCNLTNDKGEYIRHPLTFLMEAADSICYYIMDIEDAIQKQWIKYEDLVSKIQNISHDIGDKLITKENKYSKKEWVDLRTKLLTYLMEIATNEFVENLDDIVAGKYNKELIEENKVTKLLKEESRKNILSNREIMSLEVTGEAVITGILNAYIKYFFHAEKSFRKRGKTLISKSIFMTVLHEHIELKSEDENFKNKYGEYKSTQGECESIENLYEQFDVADFSVEERLRIIRDFIACMTDKFALNHLRKLNGQKI